MDASFFTFGAQAPDAALTLNRVALGTFFAISGYLKLFNASRHATLARTLQDAGVPSLPIMQWLVPSVEQVQDRAALTPSSPHASQPDAIHCQSTEVTMSATQMSTERKTQVPTAATVDLKLEVVVIPVADVDRSKRFYGSLGWRLDADFTNGVDWRVVQMTPPGSPCSIHFGKGVTTAVPGSVKNLYLVVSDVEAARGELIRGGADVGEAFHFTALGGPRAPGPDPNGRSYGTFATFSDPDGNSWLLQEIKTRLPGRGTNPDVATLTELLRETEEHHGKYEPTAPKHHWSTWYAAYIVGRERGRTPEEAAKDAAVHTEGGRR